MSPEQELTEPPRAESTVETGAVLIASVLATPALLGYGLAKNAEQQIRNSKIVTKVVDEAKMFTHGPVRAFKIGKPKRYT